MSVPLLSDEVSAELLALDNQFCFALQAAARAVQRAYQPVLGQLDLTYPQYLVMLVIWQWEREKNSRPTVSALGERLDLDSGTLTPLLRRLEQKGLLTRERSPLDGRELFVHATRPRRGPQEARNGGPHDAVVVFTTADSRTHRSTRPTEAFACRTRTGPGEIAMKSISFVSLAAAAIASALVAQPASAHIGMTGALEARGGNQKAFPCDGKRGEGPIYEFEPGATISLAVFEGIPHPGYFRIAFDDDGEDFTDPRSIDPIIKSRKCPYDATDQCGESDFCNDVPEKGQVVLLDHLNPHEFALAATYTWSVKLPNVECDNCTIQVVQVMEDEGAHGGYCPIDTCSDHAKSLEDVYHRCVDIKLVKGAKAGPGLSTAPLTTSDKPCAGYMAPPASETDAGTTPTEPTKPTGKADASVETPKADAATEKEEEPTGSVERDAGTGKKDAGPAKDAGKSTDTKKDSGAADEDEDEDKPSATEDGCAVASGSSEGAAWALLGIGLMFVRRRRLLSR